MNLFLKAMQQGLRFESTKGLRTTEELFKINMTGAFSLEAIAVNIHNQLQALGAVSFVSESSKEREDLALKLDIVKEVIKIRKEEKEILRDTAKRKAELEKLKGALQDKKEGALKELSEEELEERIKQLSK